MKKNRKKNPIKICYILSYRSPDYVRTKTLIGALKQLKDIKVFEAVNTSKGIFRYVQTFILLLGIRIKEKPDYYILGFRGYEIYWVVRILTAGKTLVFDHMMSPYDSLVNEKKMVKKGSFIDKLIFIYEKMILHFSDIVLTDTVLHKYFFSNLFEIPTEKIIAVPVGADEAIFRQEKEFEGKYCQHVLNVLFYGSFLPLHGMDVILKAAHLLRKHPIKFTIIGGSQKSLKEFFKMKEHLNLSNVKHIQWVPLEQLPEVIIKSDICLGGPFGNTGQARRVVTGKTFQFLSMAKPVVVGEIDYDYGFMNKKNCLLVKQASDRELAEIILWCNQNREKLFLIGKNGRDLYQKKFSINCIKKPLQGFLFR